MYAYLYMPTQDSSDLLIFSVGQNVGQGEEPWLGEQPRAGHHNCQREDSQG